jgi:hypothetical protein
MAPLPVFNDDPLTSVLGVMRFPDDLGKARAYACWRLARNAHALKFGGDALRDIAKGAADFAPIYDECRRAEIAGTAVAAITSTMFRMIMAHPEIATWERAINAVRNNDGGLASGRPLLQQYRRNMTKVAHFWGALADRGGSIGDVPEFFARAEIMLKEIADFELRRANETKPKEDVERAYSAAFHADVSDGACVALNVARIPGGFLSPAPGKRVKKDPS